MICFVTFKMVVFAKRYNYLERNDSKKKKNYPVHLTSVKFTIIYETRRVDLPNNNNNNYTSVRITKTRRRVVVVVVRFAGVDYMCL